MFHSERPPLDDHSRFKLTPLSEEEYVNTTDLPPTIHNPPPPPPPPHTETLHQTINSDSLKQQNLTFDRMLLDPPEPVDSSTFIQTSKPIVNQHSTSTTTTTMMMMNHSIPTIETTTTTLASNDDDDEVVVMNSSLTQSRPHHHLDHEPSILSQQIPSSSFSNPSFPLSIFSWIQDKLHSNPNRGDVEKSYLPPEVCVRIFHYVDHDSLFTSIRLVCKQWRQLIEEEMFFMPVSTFYKILKQELQMLKEKENSSTNLEHSNSTTNHDSTTTMMTNTVVELPPLSQIEEKDVKLQLLRFLLFKYTLKYYKTYSIGFKNFVKSTYLNFRAKEKELNSKLSHPITPPAKLFNKIGVSSESVDFLFLKIMFFEFTSNEQQEEYSKLLHEDSTNSEHQNNALSYGDGHMDRKFSIILEKKEIGFNWFEIYTKVRQEYHTFTRFMKERSTSLDQMYQMTRLFYLPFAMLLIVISMLLAFLKYIAIDYAIHETAYDSLTLPEFDYFWMICFGLIILSVTILCNIPLTVILRIFRDWIYIVEQFNIRERYKSKNIKFFFRVKKHVYFGEILRRALIHAGIFVVLLGIIVSLCLQCVRLMFPLTISYHAFTNFEFMSNYLTRETFEEGAVIMSPLLISAPFAALSYFLLSNRVYTHYMLLSNYNYLCGMAFLFALHSLFGMLLIVFMSVDMYFKVMCVGSLILLVFFSSCIFALSFEMKKNMVKKGSEEFKWMVADGVLLLLFFLSLSLFVIGFTISKYVEMPVVVAGLLMIVPLLTAFVLLSINVIFAMVNGRKSLLGRLLRTTFHFTATSMSLVGQTKKATASLGRAKQ
ncbi:hypothetical protein FDP41_012350 [Naegleria fowleri]|uniref:F-box domain-containing protein n=1 Tax=Naegleria fowleri TaxID=5763 RepID=A0A6A5BU99_NAEFO|nr:uncharacterized protein FDP41_012350 [Naegleria fowleri]KAF0981693.1 hypothetical protein FDP41_012350 [Naegleria fowleri]